MFAQCLLHCNTRIILSLKHALHSGRADVAPFYIWGNRWSSNVPAVIGPARSYPGTEAYILSFPAPDSSEVQVRAIGIAIPFNLLYPISLDLVTSLQSSLHTHCGPLWTSGGNEGAGSGGANPFQCGERNTEIASRI